MYPRIEIVTKTNFIPAGPFNQCTLCTILPSVQFFACQAVRVCAQDYGSSCRGISLLIWPLEVAGRPPVVARITLARRRAPVGRVFSMRVWGHCADTARLTRLIRGPLCGLRTTGRARYHSIVMNYITRTCTPFSLQSAKCRCSLSEG